MHVTLSIDDDLVSRAREAARRQGRTLDELVADYLRQVARSGPERVAELERLWAEEEGHSGGRRFLRSDAYQDRT